MGKRNDKVNPQRKRVRFTKEFKIEAVRLLERGGLPAGTDAAGLAKFYETVVQGMSTQAAAGASPKLLQAVVCNAMRAWPQKSKRRKSV